jgi:putative component of toxin-antitoxin plasmid stabilization module
MLEVRQTAVYSEWFAGVRGGEFVVLLAGGDKSSQVDDIRRAKALAREL